jgi:putative addiction module component (TIGR02574 family)
MNPVVLGSSMVLRPCALCELALVMYASVWRKGLLMALRRPISVKDVLGMSVPERIQLVEDIWDSIAADAKAVRVTDEEKAMLDRRLRAMRKKPNDHAPWEVVEARVRRRR